MGELTLKRKNEKNERKECNVKTLTIKRSFKPKNKNKRELRFISFKKDMEKFIKVTKTKDKSEAMDYINNLCHSIAAIYFYGNRMDIDAKMMKDQLMKVKYEVFMELYLGMSAEKLDAMGIYQKMQTTAILLMNILIKIIVESDYKIQMPCSLEEFKNEIYLRGYNPYDTPLYTINKLQRMFVIKDGQIVATDDKIQNNSLLKNSIVMVEYKPSHFLSIPYKFYKKLSKITDFELEYYIIADIMNDGETHVIPESHINDDNDAIVYYTAKLNSKTTLELIHAIITYNSLAESLDMYNDATNEGIYSGKETVKYKWKGEMVIESYADFRAKFLPFMDL